MRAPDIDLHVGTLVLHGVEARDRHRIGEALGHELTRLLTVSGLPPSLADGASVDRVDAGSFERASDGPRARPAAVGAQIARAVHQGLAR
jgi:hypothetical protein